jgi:hypothetical protein
MNATITAFMFSPFMLNMNKRIAIQQLLATGCTHQGIADQLKCHRNTVGNIKKEAPLKERPEREPPPHPLDPHRAWITAKLAEKLSFVRIDCSATGHVGP